MFSATPEVISAIQDERMRRAERARCSAAVRRMRHESQSQRLRRGSGIRWLLGRRASSPELVPASRSI